MSAKEVESLREHVRELAAASNDALIIGKLQQETMAKTLTYMQFARKFKAAMVQLRSKELQNRELMKRLDNVTEMLHSVRPSCMDEAVRLKIFFCSELFAALGGDSTGKSASAHSRRCIQQVAGRPHRADDWRFNHGAV